MQTYYTYLFGQGGGYREFFKDAEDAGIEFLLPFVDAIWTGYSKESNLYETLKTKQSIDYASYDFGTAADDNPFSVDGIEIPLPDALVEKAKNIYEIYKVRAALVEGGGKPSAADDEELHRLLNDLDEYAQKHRGFVE